ncbi:SDR family oxidoreductase [Pelagerythrobacter marensis]|uniref:SDR family oxidoreductase n=1 Tax=Pelagerythrobacter marensis TaxID=543877 RepID=A0ABZ2D856_9SPHN
MSLLADKTIIVTGASSGIGRAAARLFAAQGARLVLVARRAEMLDEVANEIARRGREAISCPGDVTAAECHARAVEAALERYGRLDGAFNNAGIVGAMKPLAELAESEWNETVAVNLTAAFLAARAQVPALLAGGGGSLVFTSTFVGSSVGMPGMGAYGSAKAGLGGLVKSITADYGHRAIRANALMAGGTDTPAAGTDEARAWAAGLHPVRRIAQPEEIANAALFLLSDLSSFVVGSALWADGGNSATKVQAGG